MKAEYIRVGMTLKLKPERQEAYGVESPNVTVTELRPHKTYKRTWVISGKDFFKPEDFAYAVFNDPRSRAFREASNNVLKQLGF